MVWRPNYNGDYYVLFSNGIYGFLRQINGVSWSCWLADGVYEQVIWSFLAEDLYSAEQLAEGYFKSCV